MISKVFLAVFFIGLSLVNCDVEETLDENDLKLQEFALDAGSNKPLDKCLKDLFNMLESNTETVEKVKQDIIEIKNNIVLSYKINSDEQEKSVIKNLLESIQNYQVNLGSVLKTLDMALNWIEKRVPMTTGNQLLVDSMEDIAERITRIKGSMASYKTDIENLKKIVNEEASIRYSTEAKTLEEAKEKVLRIIDNPLSKKYQEIKDAASNSAPNFSELNLRPLDFDSEDCKPVDKYFKKFLNFLDVKLVENVVENIKQIKGALDSEQFVIETAKKLVRLFRVSSSSLKKLLDESIAWIEKRMFVAGNLSDYNKGNGYEYIITRMYNIKKDIEEIKSSIESYGTDIESLSDIVDTLETKRYFNIITTQRYQIKSEEINAQVRNKITEIDSMLLTTKFESIRKSLSEIIKCLEEGFESSERIIQMIKKEKEGFKAFMEPLNQKGDSIETDIEEEGKKPKKNLRKLNLCRLFKSN